MKKIIEIKTWTGIHEMTYEITKWLKEQGYFNDEHTTTANKEAHIILELIELSNIKEK